MGRHKTLQWKGKGFSKLAILFLQFSPSGMLSASFLLLGGPFWTKEWECRKERRMTAASKHRKGTGNREGHGRGDRRWKQLELKTRASRTGPGQDRAPLLEYLSCPPGNEQGNGIPFGKICPFPLWLDTKEEHLPLSPTVSLCPPYKMDLSPLHCAKKS